MGHTSLLNLLKDNPVIASVKDEAGLRRALTSRAGLIFILFGNVCNIASLVKRVHQAEKAAMVHVDLIEGLSGKEIVVDYLKNTAKVDGIISSKAAVLRAAKNKNLYTVHRFFLIDSLSFHSLPKQYATSQADIIEIMPGCLTPKVLKWVQELMKRPIIASGLVCEKEDVVAALKAGAIAVSTSSFEIWDTMIDSK